MRFYIARGSIGSHFRHSVDHFKAWHAAVQSIGRAGDVPRAYYEQRQRDTAMEVDPDLAVKVTQSFYSFLGGYL